MKFPWFPFTSVVLGSSVLFAVVLSATTPEQAALELMEKDLERLSEIRSLDTSAPFRKLFKIEFQGQNLERWFRERIQVVEYSNNLLSRDNKAHLPSRQSRLQLTALNASTPEKPKRLILSALYLSNKLTWIERVAILIHEARHSDPDVLEHTACPDNHPKKMFRGLKACDQNIYGSYGFELIFLNEIAINCDSCNESTQQGARALFLKFQDRVLDFKLPLDN